MSSDLVELPIEVEVTSERYGTLRSVNVLSGDDIPPELDTQEWRLEELSVESHVRDQIDIRAINETTKIGVVRVDANTLEWKFIENKR
ncbi:hypothetical protein ACOZ35_07630 [Halorubrum xinjiangense]|uniref:hypothetical protein n=1 Tax=Halorubrum xinjiangense TaxID=261291 RepID=UPI003C700A13